MVFGVEALEDSREFSRAHFDDGTVVQGATAGKETLLANLRPLVDLLDQYASVCNEVISLFAHIILRLFETINNIGSPVELLTIPRSRRQRNHSSICGFDDVSRITCCICFIHEKSILLQPCNHICVCAYCVEELLETYEDPLCPLCRSIITSYVDVYI
uniref:RING-type domain-containing protein n=1 Tax=Setaria digitata TaxID=48799 RepID=A0A915PWG9_9BILA